MANIPFEYVPNTTGLKMLLRAPSGTRVWNGSAVVTYASLANTAALMACYQAVTEQQLTDLTKIGTFILACPDLGVVEIGLWKGIVKLSPTAVNDPTLVEVSFFWNGRDLTDVGNVSADVRADQVVNTDNGSQWVLEHLLEGTSTVRFQKEMQQVTESPITAVTQRPANFIRP